jgi:nicotinamidase-related amidase
MTPSLLIVDLQRDYFPGGAFPLPHAPEAIEAAGRVLDAWRSEGRPVVHLRHVWDAPDATFMRPGTDGVEIHARVAPADGESVIDKAMPNGFVGTDLEEQLRGLDTDELVVLGMMSNMCVDGTARAAADLGFSVTVVHDACAAADLEFAGESIPAASVHGAFMAALADAYASVVGADELLARD